MKKRKLKFIHTFSLLLGILVITVFININKNISYINEVKDNYTHSKSLEKIEDAVPDGAIEVVTTEELSNLDKGDPNLEESVMALAANASQTTKRKQYTVVIDPGHGGPDPGSSGKKGTLEKDIVLSVALKLGPILENKGYKVIYTRKTDKIAWSGQKEELLQRARISNNSNADIFISIHANASELSNIRGVETYYNRASSKGKKLAQSVQNEVIKQVKLKDRGIRTENYSVLRNVSAPSILVELGYISTPAEEDILKNPQYQAKFAQGIANGVFKYFEH